MQTKADLDSMYELMGERWAVIKVVGGDGVGNMYHITAHPASYQDSDLLAENLKYSEAKGIKKLLESGEEYVST